MMVSNKLFEVLQALVYVALNSGAKPVSSKRVCEAMGVQSRHLEQALQKLVRSGILCGSRGPAGGYSLAKERRKITALDVWTSLNEEETGMPYSMVHGLYEEVSRVVNDTLAHVTLEELCQQALKGQSAQKRSDFTI